MTPSSRNLLLMNDYGADPLWYAESGVMANLDDLPLSDEARASVRAWAAEWDRLATEDLHAGYGDSPERPQEVPPPEAWAAHDREASGVWSVLRQELGQDWRVGLVSFPGGHRHVQWDPCGPVELFRPGS